MVEKNRYSPLRREVAKSVTCWAQDNFQLHGETALCIGPGNPSEVQGLFLHRRHLSNSQTLSLLTVTFHFNFFIGIMSCHVLTIPILNDFNNHNIRLPNSITILMAHHYQLQTRFWNLCVDLKKQLNWEP